MVLASFSFFQIMPVWRCEVIGVDAPHQACDGVRISDDLKRPPDAVESDVG